MNVSCFVYNNFWIEDKINSVSWFFTSCNLTHICFSSWFRAATKMHKQLWSKFNQIFNWKEFVWVRTQSSKGRSGCNDCFPVNWLSIKICTRSFFTRTRRCLRLRFTCCMLTIYFVPLTGQSSRQPGSVSTADEYESWGDAGSFPFCSIKTTRVNLMMYEWWWVALIWKSLWVQRLLT